MGAFEEKIARMGRNIRGNVQWLKATVTSSAVLAASATAFSGPAIGGEFAIEDVVIKTDGTGLSTGTTFRIVTNNAKGTTTVFMTRVSKLGANKTVTMSSAFADTLNDSNNQNVNQPTVLEQGKTLSVQNTDAASTGAGTIDIYVKLRKLSDTSRITNA